MRTFQAERLAELEAERLKREQEEEEANNPMKVSLDESSHNSLCYQNTSVCIIKEYCMVGFIWSKTSQAQSVINNC